MMLMLRLLALILTSCLSLLPTRTDAFAAWFVDRRASCFADLAPNEIIMNNGVLPHSSSREPSIRLEVSPLLGDAANDVAEPNSEYVVKFVLPDEARARLSDVQYVLELTDPSSSGSGRQPPNPPIAKFTVASPGGGIGCEGRRANGRTSNNSATDSSSIFTINGDAARGASLEIVAGWATGHEAVTLTEKVTLVVGGGVIVKGGTDAKKIEDAPADDDALEDDEAEAEFEEAIVEEEREHLEREIEEAEEDAVEALEEKRQETEGDWSGINEAEEEVVEVLEANRKDVSAAVESLKEEIMAKHRATAERLEEHKKHDAAARLEAQRKKRERQNGRDRKSLDSKLEEMHRRFQKKNDDARKDKLDELMDLKGTLTESFAKMKDADRREHERARREHIKLLPKEELRVDMEELKKKARERMHNLSEKIDKLGVNELMKDPRVKKIRKNLIRGGEAEFHGDRGKPLPPEGRHFLVVMFVLFGLVGSVRWYLDKRRRANKGRRKL